MIHSLMDQTHNIVKSFQDEQFDDGIMNGHSYPFGRLAGSLRKLLFKEHLGLIDVDLKRHGVNIDDPCADHFYRNVWKTTSRINTEIYEEVSAWLYYYMD